MPVDLLTALASVEDPQVAPRSAAQVRRGPSDRGLRGACRGTTFTAISEWAHDLTPAVRIRFGLGRTVPSESTIRCVLQAIDAEGLDGGRLRPTQSDPPSPTSPDTPTGA